MIGQWSLRRRLLVSLVALAAVLFGGSAAQNYLAFREASSRLFDDSLRESAGLLLQLAEHEVAEHGRMLGIELLKMETRSAPYGFRFQIWTPDMQSGYVAADLPAMPFLPFGAEGLGWTDIDGERWRAFSLWNEDRTLQIQIAQRQQVRTAPLHDALLRMLASFLVLLLLAGALIWWVLTASFRPLRDTTASVRQRGEHDLSPVDDARAPREVRPLVDAINRLLQRLGASLNAERRFTADAAHELRTPLAAIRANAQVLMGARDAAERDRTARDLMASVDRSTRLVDQLLALARADRPFEASRLRDVDLAAIASEQVEAHRAAAERQDVRLTGDLDAAVLRGDPALLAVMLRNLLDNALRYTPSTGTVRVTSGRPAGVAEITVEDSGPGIPPEERQRVFERFHRLAGSGATGSGLGLSIVQRIVELHGGEVRIEEGEGGRGTRVRVRFGAPSGGGQDAGELAQRGGGVAPVGEPDVRRQA